MKGWQTEYLDELQRTAGKTARFEHKGGGWFKLIVTGEEYFAAAHRKAEIIAMTERLKTRPNKGAATCGS